MTTAADLLVGLNRRVSLQVVGLGVGLFAFVSAVFYTEVNNLWPLPAGATGLVVLVGLAATHAYYNAGIVPTWALVYGAAQPAFLVHAPRGGPRFAVEAATVPGAVGAALAVALAAGTAGFVLGLAIRRYRDRTRDTRYEPSPAVLSDLLLGRNRRVTAGHLAFGVVLVPVGLGFTLARGLFPLLVVGLGLVAVVAAIQAYRNGGLLVSWLLASLPVLGFVSGVQYGPATPQAPLVYAVGTAALVGVPVGTVSFLVGAAARHWRPPDDAGRDTPEVTS